MHVNFRFKMNTNGLTSAAIQRRCMVVKPKMSTESQNRFMMGRGFTQRVPLQRCELIRLFAVMNKVIHHCWLPLDGTCIIRRFVKIQRMQIGD